MFSFIKDTKIMNYLQLMLILIIIPISYGCKNKETVVSSVSALQDDHYILGVQRGEITINNIKIPSLHFMYCVAPLKLKQGAEEKAPSFDDPTQCLNPFYDEATGELAQFLIIPEFENSVIEKQVEDEIARKFPEYTTKTGSFIGWAKLKNKLLQVVSVGGAAGTLVGSVYLMKASLASTLTVLTSTGVSASSVASGAGTVWAWKGAISMYWSTSYVKMIADNATSTVAGIAKKMLRAKEDNQQLVFAWDDISDDNWSNPHHIVFIKKANSSTGLMTLSDIMLLFENTYGLARNSAIECLGTKKEKGCR